MAEVKFVAEPGVGDTGRTLGSGGITGERGALGISSKACVRAEGLKNFQLKASSEVCQLLEARKDKSDANFIFHPRMLVPVHI